jgi:HlyD family secretion protein
MAFLFEHGTARAVRVGIGHHNGVAAEVVTGLEAGQQVVLHPPDTIDDGAKLKARAAPP